MRDYGVFLTSFAFYDQFYLVFEHCGPVVPLPQGFSFQGPSSNVVATYTSVYLPEYIVGVLLSQALKDGCEKAPFIKGPSMNGESRRPFFEFGCLLRIAW